MDPLEEGGDCLDPNCTGHMYLPPVVNCSCHINPPCSACTDNELICDECGYEQEELVNLLFN